MSLRVMALAASLMLGGCTVTSPAGSRSTDAAVATNTGCGDSACANAEWPQLVVALSAGQDGGSADSDGGTSVTVTALAGDIAEQANRGGCPGGFDVISCQYYFYGNPGLTQMTLQIAVGDAPVTSKVIPLMAFNYCGNNLAYVHFALTGSDPPAIISDPEYVSPCNMLP